MEHDLYVGEIGVKIQQYTWAIVDSNSWLITEGTHGLLIDAIENKKLEDTIKDLDDLTIVLTHSHFDHIIGLNSIRELRPDATVIATEKCSENIGNIYRNMSATATAFMQFYEKGKKGDIEIAPFVCNPADSTISEQVRVIFHGHEIDLIPVYGHSEDGLIALFDDKYLFSGDTLLNITTVTRFPSGSKKRFFDEDIPLLQLLPVDTVYPGHGGEGALRDMLAVNNRSGR